MGRTLEEISNTIIKLRNGEEGLQKECSHDLVVVGNTTSGDKVEVCPICGLTKYATYRQKGDLIEGSSKLDVRECGLSFLYPASESIIIEAAQEMLLDGSRTNPDMNMSTFLGTGASKLIPYYLNSAIVERKNSAEIKEKERVKSKKSKSKVKKLDN